MPVPAEELGPSILLLADASQQECPSGVGKLSVDHSAIGTGAV